MEGVRVNRTISKTAGLKPELPNEPLSNTHCMQIRVFSVEKLVENSKKCLTMF